jgi:hypothetical protein
MVNPLVLATAHEVTGSKTAVAGLRRLCFWGSVCLPMTYLPILYGIDDSKKLPVIAGVLAVHALFLLIGRNYSR